MQKNNLRGVYFGNKEIFDELKNITDLNFKFKFPLSFNSSSFETKK